MDLQRAVSKKMASIKLEEVLPDKYFWYMRECLTQMYVVGWEQGQLEINQHGNKPIAQINCDGRTINMFGSLKKAAKLSCVSEKGIHKGMVSSRPVKGFTWQYVTQEEFDKFNSTNVTLRKIGIFHNS
jgi:hypothetical protein